MTEVDLQARHASRYRWMDAVLEDPELTDGAKILAIRLALTTNLKTGLCFPSVETLAFQTNMDPRSIRGLRAQLVEKGWIRNGGAAKAERKEERNHQKDGTVALREGWPRPQGYE